MHIDKDSWLSTTRAIAEKFIEINYSEEAPLFDAFWQAFTFKINAVFKAGTIGQLTLKQTSQIITEISIAKEYALDLMTPIIIGTVTEIMYEMRKKDFSANELEKLIGSAAARQGAKPSLTACLLRNLPKLCNELSSCKENVSEAIVSNSSVSQYRIWTEGSNRVVDSIDKYEKNKMKYLFWIDLDERPYISHITSGSRIGPEALEFLKYLVKSLGQRKPVNNVLIEVFKDTIADITGTEENRIEQQITKLNAYSNGQFRKYLYGNKFKKGIGLKNSFADKYFLFERLR